MRPGPFCGVDGGQTREPNPFRPSASRQNGLLLPRRSGKYDATGIVTAAREYRAGRAVVFTVRPVPSTRLKKIYCRSNENALVAMMNLIYS
jgi:hypothetical protein